MNQSISEREVEDEIMDLIRGSAKTAAQILGIDSDQASDAEVISAIDECVFGIQKRQGPQIDEGEHPNYLLGSLWGEQLVKKLGWHWANLIFHDYDDAKTIAVVSPDRSLAIYPFHFIEACLEGEASVTIELAYNMLVDGHNVPEIPAYKYENVMECVHHIVPRE